MLGAIIGDIVGSSREWHNIKTEEFEMIARGSKFTDDSVMTLAIAKWLMEDPLHQPESLVSIMQEFGRKYKHAGYGGNFSRWIFSDDPQPYGSYGNGSAMRVSPVGMYAKSLDEALELASISASVTHNHPEGIKGAQAIAACIYLHMHEKADKEHIKKYIEEKFGYNLSIKLEDLRPEYKFDVSCQGSVPIAIMAFLQRNKPIDVLRLAISMGGDSDTIGCMAMSIASPSLSQFTYSSIQKEIVDKCRSLLSSELLKINDQFEDFIKRPLYQSFSVCDNIFAGEYPGAKTNQEAIKKLHQIHHFGVRHFIDLTEDGELNPYVHLLPEDTTYHRFPIRDLGIPASIKDVRKLIATINDLSKLNDGYVYIHCWGGVGRTGTIVACLLAEKTEHPTSAKVLQLLRAIFKEMPKSRYRHTLETEEQIGFVNQYIEAIDNQALLKERIKDCIRGCLMAGAAGDALGYPVEFMSRHSILDEYGENGIQEFVLDENGKALVSDDTQMTLFTACGILVGITREYMGGTSGQPERYVDGAYLDWYYTQTGRKRQSSPDDFHYTWLRDLPELAHRRAPGNTCLSACESILNHQQPKNNSKGCGGIMRVAPMGLLAASCSSNHDIDFYSAPRLAIAGAHIAEVTHRHPLGYLPAALMTLLIYRLVPLTPEEAKNSIESVVIEALDVMMNINKNENMDDKEYLRQITQNAINYAHTDISDAEAISKLGEGWTAEEAWAISLYCSIRHIDNMKEAIIAAVNHNGDSDSTGSITGNIMGAIYGYEAIKKEHLFCPNDKEFESTIELSNIILALADDLFSGCIIHENDSIETPEKRQWHQRYCKMLPAGIE